MKKLLLLIALIASTFCISQERPIVVDGRLRPLFDDFILEATKWDTKYSTNYVTCVYKNVSSISIDPSIKFPSMGNYSLLTKEIGLANFTLIEPFIMRLILFHELGHAIRFDAKHSCIKCTEIMSSSTSGTFYIYTNPHVWEEEMERFFKFME